MTIYGKVEVRKVCGINEKNMKRGISKEWKINVTSIYNEIKRKWRITKIHLHLAYKVYVEILKEENGGEIRDEGFDTEKSKRF